MRVSMRDYRVYPLISGISSCANAAACCNVLDTNGATSQGIAAGNTALRIGIVLAVAAARSGNVYFLDITNSQLRLYSPASGLVSVAAGAGRFSGAAWTGGASTDGTNAANFKFSTTISSLAVDPSASESFVYIADRGSIVSATGM
jgi:hypothetical protein